MANPSKASARLNSHLEKPATRSLASGVKISNGIVLIDFSKGKHLLILLCSYVCHKNLARDAGYSHFGERNEIGKCPLHRNTPLLHCENKIESLPITAKKISTDFPDLAPLVPEVYTKLREELDKEFRSLCRN